MMNSEQTHRPGHTAELATETLPARFARLIRMGQADLDAILAAEGELSTEELTAILCADLRYRWQVGERVPAEPYVRRLPPESHEAAADLVFQEFLLRERIGERPKAEEYAVRFPELACVISDQIDLHLALATLGKQPVDSTSLTDLGTQRISDAAAIPGDAFADYEVLEEIARGGMGVVYRARQKSLNRIVALKMILTGRFATPDEIRRFRAEAEAVAQLDHPNILPIYEVGVHAGRHFFAMKYVGGGNLPMHVSRFFDHPRQAAALLSKVCRAVHFAHQRGILHRDLKPGNILLDRGDQPFVTDFGLAKWVNRGDGDTISGSVIGTPAYMAPEQAAAKTQLTTAADTYSLGAILYELLTGRPPFRGDSVLATLQLVQDVEPVPPREIQPTVDRDLETIALKCLEKEPVRRYGSAADLADDLDRWLSGDSITARPAGRWKHFRKWVRRRPAVAALAAALMLVVTGSIISLAILLAKVEDRRKDAKLAQASAERERDQAREQRRRTRQALDDMLSENGLTWLTTQPELNAQQKSFLERALKYYEEFAAEKPADAESQNDLAEANFRIAYINGALGRLPPAKSALYRSITILEQLAKDRPEVVAHRTHLASAFANLGNLLMQSGELPEAAIAVNRAIAVRMQLIAEQPTTIEHLRSLASVQSNLGVILARLSRWAEAEKTLRSALATQERLTENFPRDAEDKSLAAGSRLNLARVLAKLGRMADADSELRRSLVVYKDLAEAFPDAPNYAADLARCYITLGQLDEEEGRLSEAESEHRAGIDVQARLATKYSSSPDYRAELATSRYDLGLLLVKLERFADAEKEYRQSLALRERLVTETPTDADASFFLSVSHNGLAVLYAKCDRFVEAENAYRAALALQEKLVADHGDSPEFQQQLAVSQSNLGYLLASLNRTSEAMALDRASIQIKQKLVAEFPDNEAYRRDLANGQNNLGLLLAAVNQWSEAESLYRSAIKLRKSCKKGDSWSPEDSRDQAQTWNNLGILLLAQQRQTEAHSACKSAVEIRERLVREFPKRNDLAIDLCESLCNFGRLLSREEQQLASLAEYDRGITILEPILARSAPTKSAKVSLSNLLWGRSKALVKTGRTTDALRDCERILELADDTNKERWRLSHALILAQTDRFSEAVAEANAQVDTSSASASTVYNAACVHALAAASARAEGPTVDRYCNRSMDLLCRWCRMTDVNRCNLIFDTDLQFLKNRPEFAELLWEIALTNPR